MTYDETISWLYEQLPMFSRIGEKALTKDLSNTIVLCKRLNNPEQKFKSIHVAGTNGKGSVSHMLAAILQCAGYKTGLYTSPHLYEFKERIRVNGLPVSEQFVVDFTERMKSSAEEIKPSFFELTVAMAFEYFASQNVDIAVIETGLGGLSDSTNVITPVLSVITNIGTDHKNILGETREEIAFQKAGIIKENVPVVIGESDESVKPLFETTAREKNAPICFAEDHYEIDFTDPEGELLFCNILNLQKKVTEKLRVGLPGIYQSKNARTVLAAVDQLKKVGYAIDEKSLHEGIEQVKALTGIRGRWEILQNKPHVIADVAHNKEGIREVVFQLESVYPFAQKHFVLGFVKDKELEDVLSLFPDNAKYYFTNAQIPRALPAADLQQKSKSFCLQGDVYEDVNKALQAAKENAGLDDVICVTGSFFIIGEIKE